jgi:anti-sigma factor RsiW
VDGCQARARERRLEADIATKPAREKKVQEDLNQARKIREDFASLFN